MIVIAAIAAAWIWIRNSILVNLTPYSGET